MSLGCPCLSVCALAWVHSKKYQSGCSTKRCRHTHSVTLSSQQDVCGPGCFC
jgi:hypothetical protein